MAFVPFVMNRAGHCCTTGPGRGTGAARDDDLGESPEVVVVFEKTNDRLRRLRSQWNVMAPLMPRISPLTKLAAGETR